MTEYEVRCNPSVLASNTEGDARVLYKAFPGLFAQQTSGRALTSHGDMVRR
jgi:hypothetical protein